MLFEGLTRPDTDGAAIPALAKKIDVSNDFKTFRFLLRESFWTNGDPITAHDFVYTWKQILTPGYPAPNASLFLGIKGAKAAKMGELPLDEVGISALNDHTLVVELDAPSPHFLEMTSIHSFFPINSRWDQQHPDWADHPESGVVGNGPFTLDRWQHHEIEVVKNHKYWDADQVEIDRIVLSVLNETTALSLFENGELDWVGSPLSMIPAEAIPSLKKQGLLQITEAAGTGWFRFNTVRAPFDNRKMRKAFGHALNRQEIVDHILQGNQTPAMAIIPLSMGLTEKPYFSDHDTTTAQRLFSEALEELGLSREELPIITLSYTSSERNHKIAQAVQQQWRDVLGLRIQLRQTESKVYFDLLREGNYQLAIGSWFGDIHDPINFLEVFKYKDNGTNNTFWENSNFIQLLDLSCSEDQVTRRKQLLKAAEEILIYDMPVIPIFHYAFNYLQNPQVEDVYLSDLGYLDFKQAKVRKE